MRGAEPRSNAGRYRAPTCRACQRARSRPRARSPVPSTRAISSPTLRLTRTHAPATPTPSPRRSRARPDRALTLRTQETPPHRTTASRVVGLPPLQPEHEAACPERQGRTSLADCAFHLQFDQPVELEGVFHRQFAGDGLDEAADDGGRGFRAERAGEPPAPGAIQTRLLMAGPTAPGGAGDRTAR
jgi:hypothetical protein